MGIREQLGGMLEAALNQAVDEVLDADALKKQLHAKVDELVDGQMADLKHKLKADVIDKIDGQDDIQ